MAFLSFDDGGGGVTNLLLRSEQFDNAAWSVDSGISVTPNVALAPDGSLSMDRLSRSAGTLGSWAQLTQLVAHAAQQVAYTGSVWVRAESGTVAGQLVISDADFNTYTTAFVATTRPQRVVFTSPSSWNVAGTRIGLGVNLTTVGTTLLLWGAQLEVGTYPSAYIPTVATSATAASLHSDYVNTPAARFSSWTPTTRPYGDAVPTLAAGALVMVRYRTDYGASFTMEGIPMLAQADGANRVGIADRCIAHLLGGGTCLVQTDDSVAAIYKTCGLYPGTTPSLQLSDRRQLLYSLGVQLINLAGSPVAMNAVYA